MEEGSEEKLASDTLEHQNGKKKRGKVNDPRCMIGCMCRRKRKVRKVRERKYMGMLIVKIARYAGGKKCAR